MNAFLRLATAIVIISPLSASASKSRSVWFWQESGSTYGTANVVGNPVLENQVIAFLQYRHVKRVYGSYGARPADEPAVIAAWNAKLHAAGIQSQLLMSDNNWIFPANRNGLLDKISERVIDFNNAPGRVAAEKFDGLHLDIEPQALANWSSLAPIQKRDHLYLLRDTCVDVRGRLITEGAPGFPVFADLPVWFDKLPADGGQIGWASAAERNQWFTDIADPLTGITLMAFEQSDFSNIDSGVSWERTNITGANVRVGLEADVGPTNTWPVLPDFTAMLESLEAHYGPSGAVDIQDFTEWRNAVASLPIQAVTATLQIIDLPGGGGGGGTGGGVIGVSTEARWTYLIHFSTDLCAWQEIDRLRIAESGDMKIPVEISGRRGFWRVTRFATPRR